MLPNEETTRSDLVAKPGELEALLAVAGREQARPIVAFLKEQRLNVTLVQDADSAFEEAVLHRPNLVVVHEELPPAGGVDLCRRLKANTRTHFLPTIVFTAGSGAGTPAMRTDAYTAGADAVFAAGDLPEERRARLWALLRTQALFRRHEKKRESQGIALRERGQWLGSFMHDLQNAVGALQANFEFLSRAIGQPPPAPATDLRECTNETRGLLRELALGLRTMQEYERFESGRIGLREVVFSPAELLQQVCAEVRIELEASGQGSVTVEVDPATNQVQALATGDRDLLRRALGALVHLLRRRPGASVVRLSAGRTEAGVGFLLASNGAVISPAEEAQLFDPYAPPTRKGGLGERFALALARAIIDVHRGRVQCVEALVGGAAETGRPTAGFSIELRSRDSLPKSH